MSIELDWQEPPAGPRRPGAMKAFIDALKERPGEWALHPLPGAGSRASHTMRRYPDVEATCRSREDGSYDLYVRWVGTVEVAS